MNPSDPLAEIWQEKQRLRTALEQSRERLQEHAHRLVAPSSTATGRMGIIATAISGGMAAVEGIRMGMGFVRAVRGLFHRK